MGACPPGERENLGKRILVIDDDAALARGVARMLSFEHDVLVLTSAGDALDRIVGGERFDVVLCDLTMPGMSGADLHAELVRLAPDQAARMILMTGAHARTAGDVLSRVRWLQKPFDLDTLRTLIDAPPGDR